MYNGGFAPITDELRAAAQGAELYDFPIFPNASCDGADPDARLITRGRTPPDATRVPLTRPEWIEALRAAGGQGLPADAAAADRAYYSAHPLGEDRPLRLVVLDTLHAHPAGIGEGSAGHVDEAQLAWLMQELDAARAARELVIAMSHHRPEDLSRESPVTADALRAVLASSQELVLHLTGHGHADVRRLVLPAEGPGGHWQLMLAAPIDFPMQSRALELVDEGNGFLSIYATNLDHDAPVGSLAHRARELAAAKAVFLARTAGVELAEAWQADLESQNLLLRARLPEGVRARLAELDWPARVESEETLAALPPAAP